MFGEGISKEGDLLDLGVQHEIVEKSGSWFSYNGQRIGQGREAVKAFLKENADMAKDIESQLRAKMMPEATAADDNSNGHSEKLAEEIVGKARAGRHS
jgi:recombination protein RecA